MRSGLPCIVSDIISHLEIWERCPALFTVENTAEGWSSAIRSFIRIGPEEREQIGNANREDVKHYFSLEEMHQHYDRIYARILGKEE